MQLKTYIWGIWAVVEAMLKLKLLVVEAEVEDMLLSPLALLDKSTGNLGT